MGPKSYWRLPAAEAGCRRNPTLNFHILMKRITSASVLLLAICAWLVAGATQVASAADSKPAPQQTGAIFATSLADGGRLVISGSPVLGQNVAMTIKIDDQIVGTLMHGRTFDKYMAPGRHVVTVVPNRLLGNWVATLDVRAGQTFSYVVKANTKAIYLVPSAQPR